MKKDVIISSILVCIIGCTFNVQEESRAITLKGSTVGLTKVTIGDALLEDNDIEIQGIEEKIFTIKAMAGMLSIKNSNDGLDKLQLSISQSGEIGFSYTGDNWSCIEIDDFFMSIDKSVDLELETVDGNITIADMENFVRLTTISGNCSITTSQGCTIKTTSGDAELNLGSDSLLDTAAVYIKTASGDIDVFLPTDTAYLSKTICTITLKSTSGDVKITVPKGFSANLDYSTTSGDQEVSAFFIDNSAAKNLITCTTTSGDLTIKCYGK